MYLVYVDESGDPGLVKTNTNHFVLSGLVIHELMWRPYLTELVGFRKRLRDKYGLKLREEIHSKEFLRQPGELARIQKYRRLEILKIVLEQTAQMHHLSVVNVLVSKEGKSPDYNVFENAWTTLIQRIENTLQHSNFPDPKNEEERALVFPDRTDVTRLRRLIRRVRHYNPVANKGRPGFRNLPIQLVIEDPHFKNSKDSYFIQIADVIAYFLYQSVNPSTYIKKKGARRFFEILDPVLCKVCSPDDPLGIVHL